MTRIRTVALLTLVYLALTTNTELLNILAGLLLATGIAFLLRPEGGLADLHQLPAVAWALVRYSAILAYELLISGIQVARIVLHPSLPIRPGILAIPSQCESDEGQALSAHAITLTPGELVVEIDDDGVMYTHSLDASRAAEQVENAQKMRRELLAKILA
jgi:multicomponent Na+:H+ antiporter subunit E